MVTKPLTAILDWTMGTEAGFAAHRDPRIIAMFRKILNAWSEFLSSEDSLYVLNDSPSGWMSETARQVVGMDDYEHDPLAEHWGFTSWNDFFTRRLTSTSRPVAAPDDNKIIVSACESTPYKISSDVQRQSRFWVKNQPYSLEDLLARDEAVGHFVGGTVYQAFLSALNYHRWHAPVAGTIVRAYVKDGTYFSEADSEGADAVEATLSQAYLAHVAARPGPPREQGRRAGVLPVRRLDRVPHLPTRCYRPVRSHRYPPTAGSERTPRAGPVEACHG